MKTITLDEVIESKLEDDEFSILFEEELIKNKLAESFFILRQQKGLTQNELAVKAETTQPVIARLENGSDSGIPSLKLLHRIAHALNLKMSIKFRHIN